MQPLSPNIRRAYLVVSIVLFILIIPVAIFYADGVRYKPGYGFVRTGGIFLSVPYPDAEVWINGENIGRSGFLERSFYEGDLAPSAYIVHVERDGYLAWDRLLVVEEQLVTDSRIVLVPNEIRTVKIIAATTTTTVSTTTRAVARATYNEYLAIFAATTTASTTIPIDESDGVGLFLQKGNLVARWIQENAFPPSHFCERPSVCTDEIVLEKSGVTDARFFRGGAVYATKSVIYFAEIDIRQTPVIAELVRMNNADIRVIDDALFVKSGNSLYEINL